MVYSHLVLKKIITVCCFLFIGWWYSYDLVNHPLHEDEHAWVHRGMMFVEAYFFDFDFSTQTRQSYFSYDQPKLGEYLFGWIVKIAYHQDLHKLIQQSDFNEGWEQRGGSLWQPHFWWIQYQEKTPQQPVIPSNWQNAYQIIVVSRWVAVVAAITALFLIYWLGRKLGGWSTGIIAFLLLANHELFFLNARRAMVDTLMVSFALSSLWACWYLIANLRSQVKHYYWRIIGIGSLLGLAVATKLNGLLYLGLVMVTSVMMGIISIKNNVQYSKVILGKIKQGTLLFVSAATVFILLNPFVWDSPFEKTLQMIEWRQHISQEMQQHSPQAALYTISERFFAIGTDVLWGENAQHRSFYPWKPDWDLFLFALGLFILASLCFRPHYRLISGLTILWATITLLSMGVYLTVGFDRYFLPIVPFVVLVQALGIKALLVDLPTFLVRIVKRSI